METFGKSFIKHRGSTAELWECPFLVATLNTILHKNKYGIFQKKLKTTVSSPAMAAIQAAKASLRKEVQNKIASLTIEERKRQTENVLKKLFELPVFQTSQRISVFLSTDDEVSTEPIIRNIFDTKRFCFVPRYNKAVMEMVKLHSMKDWQELPVTKWNIKQPKLSEERENALETGGLDLVIVPGVAFTSGGIRMGHGKGYYDTFLSTLKEQQKKPPVTIAMAFKEQVLNEVPVHEHDVKIDFVLYSD